MPANFQYHCFNTTPIPLFFRPRDNTCPILALIVSPFILHLLYPRDKYLPGNLVIVFLEPGYNLFLGVLDSGLKEKAYPHRVHL